MTGGYNFLMEFIQCDICKKTMDYSMEIIRVTRSGEIGSHASFEFCSSCSEPIMKILEKKKLIRIRDKKNGGEK